ncbi:MAG: LVIVD repeat-containing protein [Bacteroidales bacterium]
MKNTLKVLMIFVAASAGIYGCMDKTIERVTYTANVPVYMSFNEFRSSFRNTDTVEITQPGKIYFKDNYLFVNEYGKGIHVIDNSNPAQPEKTAFYKILGNVDMAIKGNILFADSYIDLLAIDISNVKGPVEVGRLTNIFPEVMPDGDEKYPYAMVDKSKGVIVGWEVKPITEERDRSELWGKWIFRGDLVTFEAMIKDGAGNWSSGAGTGGSMARFMLNENYLYLIAHPWMLKIVDVKQASKMSMVDSTSVSRTMETLFKLENKLFIGTTTGMLIYDISDPESPFPISSYNHITACDPVVADGHYAYVTLRSGTRCFNTQNLLDVIDISSITVPYLVKSYPMYNPHGLGVDGNMLFVCDGKAGLKIYDKTDPLGIIANQLAHYPDFDTYDAIPVNGILMLIGQEGIYQYDYSDPKNIRQISHLPIIKQGKK